MFFSCSNYSHWFNPRQPLNRQQKHEKLIKLKEKRVRKKAREKTAQLKSLVARMLSASRKRNQRSQSEPRSLLEHHQWSLRSSRNWRQNVRSWLPKSTQRRQLLNKNHHPQHLAQWKMAAKRMTGMKMKQIKWPSWRPIGEKSAPKWNAN